MATRERVRERFGAGSSERCVFNLDPYDTMEMILSDSVCEWPQLVATAFLCLGFSQRPECKFGPGGPEMIDEVYSSGHGFAPLRSLIQKSPNKLTVQHVTQ